MKRFNFLFIAITFFAQVSYAQVSEGDFQALVALYNATDGDNWTNNTNWNINGRADDVTSDWYGVTVSGGRVTVLDFYYNNLVGSIPAEIGNLTALKSLSLWGNEISSLPAEIGNLTALTYLYLNYNLLTTIPAEIGNLTALTYLYLDRNKLTTIPTEIGNLTALAHLSLYKNQLTTIPAEIGNLTALAHLSLYNNQLTTIPAEIGSLTKLTALYLHDNQLSTIPAEIGNLTALTQLLLYDNKLDFGDLDAMNINWTNLTTGTYSPQEIIPIQYVFSDNQTIISVSVGGLNNVYQWYKDDVAISGENNDSLVVTEVVLANYYCKITNPDFPELTLVSNSLYLPAGIPKAEYDALVVIYNATNGDNWTNNTNWLSNEPVDSWYGVNASNGHVNFINLDDNNLDGYIPSEIGSFQNLYMLGLSNGNLNGSIPSNIGNLSNLTHLGLSGNNLTGNVPEEVTKLGNLWDLIVFDNQLVNLPDLSSLQNLQNISISDNYFTFEDIEPNTGLASMGFYYSPQAKVGNAQKHILVDGENDTLSVNVGGENNIYKWYRNGTEISNSNNDTLIIEGFTSSDTGNYNCEITNTLATGLTIYSDTFTLVQAYSVTFNVNDKNGNVNGATISFDNYSSTTTGEQGEAIYDKVESATDLSYTIYADGHDYYSGTLDVVDQNVQIDIQLTITGIDELDKYDAKIFPNPSTGQFNINLSEQPGKNTQLKMIDLNGKTIYQHKLSDIENKINIEGKDKGTYILQVIDGDKVYNSYKILLIE